MNHEWIRADRAADRRAALAAGTDGPVLADVDADRRRRGPYTAAGSLLRALELDGVPELVRRHDIEILIAAPELRAKYAGSRETLTSLAPAGERTRFYSRLRTARLANGLTEFLHEFLRALGGGPRWLLADNLHLADQTDREFFAILLRRADPDLLRLRVATGTAPLADPSGPIPFPLGPALDRHARPVAVLPGPEDEPEPLTPEQHDAAARELLARGERSLMLGAVPYHLERGTRRQTLGVDALYGALAGCIEHGLYHAAADVAERGLALADPVSQAEMWWQFTAKKAVSLGALGRGDEAIEVYDEARAQTTDPRWHRQAAYATSMLYTRHLGPERRDQRLARMWSNVAIALTDATADPRERAFQSVFQHNGLALVATHDGRPEEALSLVSAGIERLDRELAPGDHALHRSVLRHNRAMLHAGAGRLEESLADLRWVIEADPNYAEYRFDLGNLLRRLGRAEEAISAYGQATRLSPPFPEVYYNRGNARLDLGDFDGALADFAYVLELDPGYVDAYVNRAGLRLSLGDLGGATEDAAAGLALSPGNVHLLCVRGQLELADGDAQAADATLTTALAGDPALPAAWAARATARYELGDREAALSDLDRAVSLQDDPEVRFNRATLRAEANRHAEALEDFTAAGGDAQARWGRALSLLALGRTAEAEADLRHCEKADPELAEEARLLLQQ